MRFPVVKDPVGTTMVEQKREVPGVNGSNIFRDMRDILQKMIGSGFLHSMGDSSGRAEWAHVLALYEVVRSASLQPDEPGNVHILSRKPILVPAMSLIVVECSVKPAAGTGVIQAMVEELDVHAKYLPKGLMIAQTLVRVDMTGKVPVQVAFNPELQLAYFPEHTGVFPKPLLLIVTFLHNRNQRATILYLT